MEEIVNSFLDNGKFKIIKGEKLLATNKLGLFNEQCIRKKGELEYVIAINN